MKRVLIIAFHFPPYAGSSGVQRTLRFVQYLPLFGWDPIVLSAVPFAYEKTSDELLAEIPDSVVVERAMALDAGRHIAIRGRYPAFLARPDRWMSWRFDAIRRGVQMYRRYAPIAMWSTYPIATAHVIGAAIQQRTGLPWIADFRDPMAQDGYPSDPETWRRFRSIEEQTIRSARKAVFVTPGAARYYRAQFMEFSPERFDVIENGYDEEAFAAVERETDKGLQLNPGKITWLHSGIVYPSERDPTQLFAALGALLARQVISKDSLRVRFRAPGHEKMLQDLVSRFALEGMVELLPAIPYREAIGEMIRADGLLLLQGATCNDQIPAKLYEYMRARRSIIGLIDPAGDTALALREVGIKEIAPLESKEAIERFLSKVFTSRLNNPLADDQLLIARPEKISGASRQGRAHKLAELLDEVVVNPEPSLADLPRKSVLARHHQT